MVAAAALAGCEALEAVVSPGGGAVEPAPLPPPPGWPSPVHDPTIFAEGDLYWVVATGPGLPVWRSRDLRQWRRAGRIFAADVPEWAAEVIPGATDVWAPDVVRVGERLILTYAVSTFGSRRSAIGAAVNDSFDPRNPAAGWRDLGPIFQSAEGDTYNAIDPQVFVARDGRLMMAFGSMASGILLTQVDPRNLRPRGGPAVQIAARPSGRPIEAPYLVQRGGWWYLFVSFDACCRGTASTYNLRVGRSANLSGPYIDRDGRPMLEGGGTLLLAGEPPRIGPGHCSVIQHGGQWHLAHHYYDGLASGRPTLSIRPLLWDAEGWPQLGEPLLPEAPPPPSPAGEAATLAE